MNAQGRNWAIGIIVLVILIALGTWADTSQGPASSPASTATSTATTYTVGSTTDGIAVSGGSATVKEVDTTLPTAPNYKKPIAYGADVSADVRAALNAELATAQSEIAANGQNFDAWIGLGTLYKMGGDYQDAATVWTYVSQVWPGNSVSFNNLGDLYTNFLHDYPKAAAEYKQQLANSPTDVQDYIDLYMLYTNQYPQSSSTVIALLSQGLKANPGNAQLQATLSAYESTK